MKPNQIICGNNIDVVKSWPANCIDGVATDPPYELGFMGKDWDSSGIAYSVPMWRQLLRITKPGGFLLCFGGTRTSHRLTCAIEDAGWQIRDCMMWLYGSGFPKSHNISKAIDKAAGTKRKVIGKKVSPYTPTGRNESPDYGDYAQPTNEKGYLQYDITAPTTNLAQLWDGYGTALKPAWEPIIVAMKPLDGTFAANAERWGVAGLNIDGGRIGTKDNLDGGAYSKGKQSDGEWGTMHNYTGGEYEQPQGRWPANLILDEESVKMLDEQAGKKKSGFMSAGTKRLMSSNPNKNTYGTFKPDTVKNDTYGDSGGASRFFYCTKASRKERNLGLGDTSGKKVNDGRQTPIDNPYQRGGETIRQNTHPTVKPLALMKYLCTLLKMPGQNQIILDPFMGSGTTGIACAELKIGFLGIEKEPEYCEISQKRIAAVSGITLPINKNTELARLAVDSTDGDCQPKLPYISEHRQSIINAASAKLRSNK